MSSPPASRRTHVHVCVCVFALRSVPMERCWSRVTRWCNTRPLRRFLPRAARLPRFLAPLLLPCSFPGATYSPPMLFSVPHSDAILRISQSNPVSPRHPSIMCDPSHPPFVHSLDAFRRCALARLGFLLGAAPARPSASLSPPVQDGWMHRVGGRMNEWMHRREGGREG